MIQFSRNIYTQALMRLYSFYWYLNLGISAGIYRKSLNLDAKECIEN